MLLPDKKILWDWLPDFIMYPFQSKLTIVLLKQFSQELCEPSWISRGLNSLDKRHNHKSFWNNLFSRFGSCCDGWKTWKTVSFLEAFCFIWEDVWDTLLIPSKIPFVFLCILTFWSLWSLAKGCTVTHLAYFLCHTFHRHLQILVSFAFVKGCFQNDPIPVPYYILISIICLSSHFTVSSKENLGKPFTNLCGNLLHPIQVNTTYFSFPITAGQNFAKFSTTTE